MKTKGAKRGISLITLVITIVVMIIISAAVVLTLFGENGIITRAKEARISSDLAVYKEELNMYILNKHTENPSFVNETLTAGEENLVYNTQPQGEKGNIKTVIKSLSDEYLGKLEIIKGELLINTKDKLEIEVAQKLGIEVNPYDIIDGVLISSNGNLLLMDEKTGTLTIPDTVEEIGEGAFSNLSGLKTIIIPSTVKRIAMNAFAYNSTLEQVIMQEREKEDGTIEGVEYIGGRAFQYCGNLITVQMANSVKEIGSLAFFHCEKLQNITLSDNIKVLKDHTFSDCTSLTKIELPKNLEEIEARAFFKCNLKEITLPKNLEKMGNDVFGQNKNLSIIKIAEGNEIFEFDETRGMLIQKNNELKEKDIVFMTDNALKSNTTLDVPEGVTGIEVVLDIYNIQTVKLPSSLKNIDADKLPKSVSKIELDPNNNTYVVEGDCLYTKDKKKLIICYIKDEIIEKTDLAEELEIITPKAFKPATNLKNIELPDSVLSVESYAFPNSKIKSIVLGEKVEYIDPFFKGINYLPQVSISSNNPNYSIENNVLYNKDKTELKAVLYNISGKYTVNSNVTKIGNSAFSYQHGMTEVELPNKLIEIGNSFNFCNGLEKIEIPSSVTSIHTSCFLNSPNLKEIRVHKKKGSIIGSPWGCIYGDKAIIWDE